MARQKIQKRKGGIRKHGRNKRAKNQAMSSYVRGKITFEQYFRRIKQG